MMVFSTLRRGALRMTFAAYTRFWLKRFPHAVRIESTNACNADCAICPRRKMTRPVGFMNMDLYRRLIEECGRREVSTVHLHNYGEPLLDPDLFERIKMARAAGIRHVRIFSNGALLTPAAGARLIESGLTEIKVSMDGLDEQTFNKIRKGLDLAQVSANLERFVRMRNEKGRRLPRVGVVFTQTPQNEAETPRFLEHWQSRVDKVFVTRVHNWGGRRRTGDEGKPAHNPWPCPRLWQTFTVLWDGRAALCCMDYNGDVVLGDTNRQTIFEIFNGEALARIRSCFFRNDLREVPMCQTCSLHHRGRARRGEAGE